MITVALDVMASDHGPAATVGGAAAASLGEHAPRILLVGDDPEIQKVLDHVEHDPARLRVVHAPAFIPMHASAREALDDTPDASIAVAARLVHEGEADVLVSAGNTGAVTMACARAFGRLPGVRRSALGAVYPTERRRGEKDDPFSLILDAGLTLEAGADDLVSFATMGAAYAALVSRNPRPRVALLSNGTEPSKGPPAVVEAHARLRERADLDFIGNIEGMDIPKGTADVVVTSGFMGNVVLKMLEGVAQTVLRLGRYAMKQKLRYKAGLALLAPAVKQLREVTDWEQYGGAPILGFDRLCIKAHGRSTAVAVTNAIKVATRATRSGLVETMRAALA
jgi:glycerol-3-phosphate acyltransferase PlsX